MNRMILKLTPYNNGSTFLFRRLTQGVGLLFLFCLLFVPLVLHAEPGDLDPGFGEGGKVLTSIQIGAEQMDDYPSAVLLQPDGKIIVAGLAAQHSSSGTYLALVRYQPDGSLDISFGDEGRVMLLKGACASIFDLALQSDGKIIALAASGCQGFSIESTILRLNIDGSLDPSFGQAGKLQLDIPERYINISTLTLLEDDKILVGGSITPFFPNPNAFDFLLARFTATGLLDDTFGTDGIVVSDLDGADEYLRALAIQPDGKIVAVGHAEVDSNNFDLRIVRYTAAGLFDTSFDGDGIAVLALSSANENVAAVALQSDGKIVVAGSIYGTSTSDLFVTRLTGGGSVDSSFADAGLLLVDFGGYEAAKDLVIQSDGKMVVADLSRILRFDSTGLPDIPFAGDGAFENNQTFEMLALQPNGMIVAAGVAMDPNGLYEQFSTVQLAVDGELDVTFGGTGTVITGFQNLIYGNGSLAAIKQQSHGTFLVAGSVNNGLNSDILLARYLNDGSLDLTFSDGGKTITDLGNFRHEFAIDLLLLSNGKLLAIGGTYDESTDNREIILVRYNADGTIDPTFATNGVVVTELGATADESVAAATLQSDGKIVVVGSIRENDSRLKLLVMRYNSNGSLDATFGNGGTVILELSPDADDRAIGVFVQADGKLMVVANTAVYDTGLDDYLRQAALVRFLANGTLDTTFGSGGIVTTGLANTDINANTMALQADGKIVVAGNADGYATSSSDFALARYNSDGSLDTAFGANGLVIQDMGSRELEIIDAIAIQSNGKLVVAGTIYVDSGFGSEKFITARFNVAGTLDTAFGSNGQILTSFGPDYNAQANELVIQSDGKLVVAGSSDAVNFEQPTQLALVRYFGDVVNQAPTANNQTVTTNEDNPTSITLTAADPDSDPLSYTVVANPQHGTLTGSAPNLTYTPAANYAGADSFTFKVNDGQVDSNVATVNITINPVNDLPTATSQTLSTNEDTPLAITLAGSDVEGSALTFAIVGNPTKGTLTGSGANRTYTPNANLNGADSFTFKVNDGQFDSAVATVNITINAVNDPPMATTQSVSTNKNTALAVILAGSDVEGSPLTFTVVNNPAHGTLSGTAPNLTYTPATNYSGSDSFTFKANDGQADSTIATVTITVNAVNDPPTANDQSLTTAEDTALGITLSGSDPDGDPLIVTIVDAPVHGTLSGTGFNRSYSPTANYNGSDSFTFRLNDGTVNSNLATVTIAITAVNDAPVADNDSYATSRNTVLSVAVGDGLLNGDSDLDSNALTALLVTPPTHGTVNLNPNGAFTYTPATSYSGSDSFTYKANDGQLDSNVATVSLTVNFANSAPTATGQTVTTAEDQPLAITLTATDPDGDTLAYTLTTLPTHGTVSGEAPALLYTPFANFNGSDSFAFHVNDGTVDSNTATVALNVTAVNDAPTNLSLSNSTVQENQPGGTLVGQLSTVDVDLADSHSYTLVGGATTAFTIVGAELRTAAAFDFETQNSYALTIRTADGQGGQFEKAFTVTILDVNEESSDPTITLVLTANPQSRQNFRLTGSGGIGLIRLDDITPQDGDAYSNSKTLTVAPGSYTFSERIPSGWLLSAITCSPAANAVVALADARVTVTVATGDNVTCTFANDRWVSIRTLKYNDRNGNGRRNGNEPYLAGWTMTVYNSAGTQVASAVTNRNGKANFNFLPWQPYTVCETQQPGWSNTEPAALNPTFNQPCYTLTLNPGQIGTVRFGNRNLPATKTVTATMAANENVTITAWLEVLDDEAGYGDSTFVDEDLEQAADEESWIYLPLVTR